jgi:AraC-like DNA-binding protein
MFCKKENKQIIQTMSSFFKPIQKIISCIIFLLALSMSLCAQHNIDSIKDLSFEELKRHFEKSYVDTVKDLIYANIYLEKAKKDKDTLKIADAYYFLSTFYSAEAALKYTDSIIVITKNLNGHKSYPALAYVIKGIVYYESGELQKAVDNYVIAYQYAKKNKNYKLLATTNYSIGIIKTYLGEKEEALKIFSENIKFIETHDISGKNLLLCNMMIGVADAYITNNKYDSAAIFIDKGIELSRAEDFKNFYAEYLILSGVNNFYKKEYQLSIDSILKAISIHDLRSNISAAYLYLGKSNYAMGNTQISLNYFFKVDSFLQNNNYVTQELLEAYPPIINYFKNEKDYKKQLLFTNQLIRYDSIFNATKTAVSKDIVKKYEIPLLLTSKEELIDKLNKDKNSSTRNIYFLLSFSFLSIISLLLFVTKNRKYKKRFEKLIIQLKEKESNKNDEDKMHFIEEIKSENAPANMDDELVSTILNNLQKFENSMRFTNSNYTLNKLAKELKTNSSYLSKIINDHKGQNFPNYLKTLRIDLAIDRLKSEPQFRDYTIQAIAEEVGFKTAQLFSATFHKKTGIYPSYFIKQLEKHIK